MKGLLRLKPFDETADEVEPGAVYAKSWALTLGVAASAGLASLALLLAATGSTAAMTVLAICVAISSVTAHLEWHAGLRARALNQLFATLLFVSMALLVDSAK